ncbi:MAG: AAA family ATPase [Sulfurospirillum sp.]
MIERLLENSVLYLNSLKSIHKRYFYETIEHKDKLIGIIGARGVGKTTYILNYLKSLDIALNKKLYISADSVELANISLLDIAKEFYKIGGEVLAIDEIHKYKNFEIELKQIHDMLDLKVIFSGSSAIELEHSKADLSRRAVIYRVSGLSFREFLEFKTGVSFKSYSLKEILEKHTDIAFEITQKIKPYEYWSEYLDFGYYPFYFENPDRYKLKLNETVNTVIEVDIPSIFQIKYEYIINLKKLVTLICNSNPFKLNIKELSSKVGIDRDTLYLYLDYLHKGKIFNVIRAKTKGDNIFSKPDKIFLNNPNLNFSYCQDANIGTIRETVFAVLLSVVHNVKIPKDGDFLIDDTYLFEIGGKNKGFKQIKDIENSFVVADDIEVGFGSKIPLWLFGFLY